MRHPISGGTLSIANEIITIGLIRPNPRRACLDLIFSSPPKARADNGCPIGKSGHQIQRSKLGRCDLDETPPSARDLEILAAKQDAAEAYASNVAGTGSTQQLTAALSRVEAVTGERSRPTTARSGPVAYGYVGVSSEAQINWYFCGPATAQDILWYLGPTTSYNLDSVTGVHDSFDYTDSHDQNILANDYWLATVKNGGTNWGNLYMPFTLNGWHRGGWYVGTDSANLTSSGAWIDVDFDTNNGHPVAENVYYGSSTYYPSGFTPSYSGYYHWDVLYQTFTVSGAQWAGIAEPWPYPGAGTRTPYQSQTWSDIWSAISANHGIVW